MLSLLNTKPNIKMKKLLKEYGFFSDMQYFEMIVDSFINGQITQAKSQFKVMPKKWRIAFIQSANSSWNSGLEQRFISELTELI